MNSNLVDPQKTCLVVVDIQNDYCTDDSPLASVRGFDLSPVRAIAEPLVVFVDSAKKAGLKVIYTKMDEYHMDMPKNAQLKYASSKHSLDIAKPGTEGYEYYKVQPQPDDIEIKKNSYDAFINPEMEAALKTLGVENVIFVGAYTAACVDSTLRSAYTRGYNCVVAEDLVAMPLERKHLHDAAIENWRILFAEVVNSQDIVKAWNEL